MSKSRKIYHTENIESKKLRKEKLRNYLQNQKSKLIEDL